MPNIHARVCVCVCVCVCVLERITEVLMEDESEEELGAGVRAAFNGFKTQLRAHFSVSTKTRLFTFNYFVSIGFTPLNEQ